MKYFIDAITKHYADFQGRARRKEYWMFHLFYTVIIMLSYSVIVGALLTAISGEGDPAEAFPILSLLLFLALYLGLLVPSLAIQVRRLHDIGKSGWFLLVILIPFVGVIWFLVLMCTDSQPNTNQYGPNPKGVGGAVANTAPSAGFCASCGAPRTSGTAFCGACGKPA